MAKESQALKKRKEIATKLVNYGFSYVDLGRYFDTKPRVFEQYAKQGEIPEVKNKYQYSSFVDALIEKRNNSLANELRAGKKYADVLISYGLLNIPTEKEFKKIIESVRNGLDIPEASDEKSNSFFQWIGDSCVNKGLFEDLSDETLRNKIVSKYQRDTGYSKSVAVINIIKDGFNPRNCEVFAKQIKDTVLFYKYQKMEEVFELYSLNTKISDICKYTSLTKEQVEDYVEKAKEAGIECVLTPSKEENIRNSGFDRKEIEEAYGMRLYGVDSEYVKLAKSGDKPLAHKKENRREEMFYMYNELKMTQQEIADELGLSRATVCHDIRTYERDHYDKVDKSILWQQRNINAQMRMEKEQKTSAILDAFEKSLSAREISEKSGYSENTVRKTLFENSLKTENMERNSAPTPISKRNMQEFQAAFAYQKPAFEHHGPTTELKNLVGRSRAQVLADQKKMSKEIKANSLIIGRLANKDLKKDFAKIKSENAMEER